MTGHGYGDYREWKSWKAEAFGECRKDEAAYFAAELTRSGVGDLKRKRVLEIGFGNGAFATWSRKQGADYAGSELIPELRTLAQQAGLHVLDGSSPLAEQLGPGTVDLVVAFDVFEHIDLERLRVLFADLHSCIRSGGLVIARVPSGDSPFSGTIQHGDLTHRSVLGSSAVRQLARAAGFTDVTTREPVLPLGGAGCLGVLRRLMVRAARRVAYPFITRALMGGGQPVLSRNMLFVLRRS